MVSLLQSTVRQCGQCLFLCICMSVCQGVCVCVCVWKYRSSQAGRLVWLVISPLRPGPVTSAVLAVMTDWPSRPHMGCCADPLWQNRYTAGGQMGWALTDLTCVFHLFRCIVAEQKRTWLLHIYITVNHQINCPGSYGKNKSPQLTVTSCGLFWQSQQTCAHQCLCLILQALL